MLTRKLWVFLYLTLAKSQYPAPSAHYSSIRPPGVTPNPAVYQQGGAPQQSELSSWQEAVFLFVYTVTNWKAWKRVDYYQSLHRKWGCQYAVFPPHPPFFYIHNFFLFILISFPLKQHLPFVKYPLCCLRPSLHLTHAHARSSCLPYLFPRVASYSCSLHSPPERQNI